MALLYPEYLHNIQYEAIKDRYALFAGMQEGAVGASDVRVSQRAAGANMTVDVAAGRCLVQGDAVARQGLYHLVNDAAITGTTIAANASGQPRLDQIVLQINDATDAGAGSDIPTVTALTGTPTAGATLDNRSGAAALPNSALRLADVLVANGAASILDASIRDRRTWARGAHLIVQQTSGGNYTTASTSFVVIDNTNLAARIECSGVPLRITFNGNFSLINALNGVLVSPFADAANVILAGAPQLLFTTPTAAGNGAMAATWEIVPTAGSHYFAMYWKVGGSTATLYRDGANVVQMQIEEIVKQNSNNN